MGDLSYFIKKRETLDHNTATLDLLKKYPNPKAGGLNEVVVRHFLKQLAAALEFLRARNLIHRDVKPQNLLLNPSPLFYAMGKPEVVPFAASENSLVPAVGVESLPMLKLADFGFARSLPSTSLAETLCGSPLYMAPEILRYEKYDAKADLWSVGTVLYEMMVARPPFRAANHVDLLRKIEQGEDRIKFPPEVLLSDDIKKLIRGLLKRNPVERMPFENFFASPVIKDEIPGLVGADRPTPKSRPPSETNLAEMGSRRKSSISQDPRALGTEREEGRQSQSPREAPLSSSPASPARKNAPPMSRQPSGTPPRPAQVRRLSKEQIPPFATGDRMPTNTTHARRPSIHTHPTAPARQELHERSPPIAERPSIRNTPTSGPSLLREQMQGQRERERDNRRTDDRDGKEATDRAAQEVSFEREYVMVEKRAVEMNAFADELAASPRIHGVQGNNAPQAGAMVRRATTQGAPTAVTGAQATNSRAMQIAGGRQPAHHRQSSYERRYGPSPTSATSAISRAINLASGRLFGAGFSPPLNLGRGGRSPPIGYNPFPAYPTSQNNALLLEDVKSKEPLDADQKAVQIIEEAATRSDVVYGFAEVKYKQLIPLAPSVQAGLNIRPMSNTPKGENDSGSAVEDDGLTVDAVVTLSEEALVLYVKALSLLAKSMDIAGAWWASTSRLEPVGEASSPSSKIETTSTSNAATRNRINNVVQWVRNRFNEVLEKAEFVRLKLIESQRRLPVDHPSHPSNQSTSAASTSALGTSADNVFITSGVTAEKLMYDRALEMSRSAAINELTGEDLAGCEIAYVTAVRMLEAVLEDDEEPKGGRKKSGGSEDRGVKGAESVNGVEAEDREVVLKRKSLPVPWVVSRMD